MSEQSWLRRRWKLVVNILTLLALTIAIIFSRHQILDTIKNLGHVHAGLLLLMIPIEALNYHAQTRLYQGLFSIVGNKLSYRFLYRASLELNFVNHVFPSGGVTGLSFFSLRMRKGKELTGARATLIHLIKVSMYIIAYEIILLFGIIALAAMGRVNNFVMLVASSLSTLLIVGTFAFFYIVGRRERINSFFTGATRGVNWLIHLVRPKYPETINISQARKVFDDFHDNYKEIKQSWRKLKAPFLYSILADVTEIAAVYVVY
ncbi:MAG: lysylphosphatidylglycerol synthase domain-containing protein, partial [Candidatus Saccharimonadales bacterium]